MIPKPCARCGHDHGTFTPELAACLFEHGKEQTMTPLESCGDTEVPERRHGGVVLHSSSHDLRAEIATELANRLGTHEHLERCRALLIRADAELRGLEARLAEARVAQNSNGAVAVMENERANALMGLSGNIIVLSPDEKARVRAAVHVQSPPHAHARLKASAAAQRFRAGEIGDAVISKITRRHAATVIEREARMAFRRAATAEAMDYAATLLVTGK